MDIDKEIEAAIAKFKNFDDKHLLLEKHKLDAEIGHLTIEQIKPEQNEDILDYVALKYLIEQRSKEVRKNQIFTEIQAQLIVVFTAVLALEALYNLIEKITKHWF